MLSQAAFSTEMKKLKAAKAKAQKQLAELEAAEKREIDNKISEMNHQWSKFCASLDVDAYHKALELWSKLEKDGKKQPLPKVDTVKQYRKGFTIEDLDRNDFATDQLNLLDAAAQNLNNDLDSHVLLAKFIMQAKDTASELSE